MKRRAPLRGQTIPCSTDRADTLIEAVGPRSPLGVRLTKIADAAPSGTSGKFSVGFWVEGVLDANPQVGQSVTMLHWVFRNSLNKRWDYFYTSEVISAEGRLIRTRNSVYEITPIGQPPSREGMAR